MPVIVEAVNLVKIYRNGVKAVDGVSFEAGPGITMLMGPNGSGKTTTLSMVAGALKPTSGSVYIGGLDVWGREWRRARSLVGFAPQNMPFKERLNALENLVWHGLIKGMSIRESKRRGRELLEVFGMEDHAGFMVGKLSGGLRRRLSIAAALLGDPEVLVLDEPTSGLDPAARRSLWRRLRSLAGEKCVVASTHIASDAEENAGKVLVFHKGRIVAEGSPEELVERYSPGSVTVVEGRITGVPEVDGTSVVESSGERVVYMVRDPDTVLPRIIEAMVRAGSRVERVEVRKPGLGEVYLRLTGVRLEGA